MESKKWKKNNKYHFSKLVGRRQDKKKQRSQQKNRKKQKKKHKIIIFPLTRIDFLKLTKTALLKFKIVSLSFTINSVTHTLINFNLVLLSR